MERRRVKSLIHSPETVKARHMLPDGSGPEAAGIANRLKEEEELASPIRRNAQLETGITGSVRGKVFDDRMNLRGP